MAYPSDPVELRGLRPEPNGTPAALAPIAREVLGWVADRRRTMIQMRAHLTGTTINECLDRIDDETRRIELCALATLDVGMLHDLYCIGPIKEAPDGETADPQE